MKILHVISTLNPVYGGPIEGVKRLALEVINQGHEVEVVVTDQVDSPWLVGLEFKVHALGPAFHVYAFSTKLRKWLQKNILEYDAIIVEGIWQYTGYITRKLLRNIDIPYYVFTHGQLGTWFKHEFPIKHIKKWIYWSITGHKLLTDAEAVLFTTEEEMYQSRRAFWLYKCREVVVGYGAAISDGNTDDQKKNILSHYPELIGKRLFLFLGRLDRQKACDLLLEAFSQVVRMDPNLHLLMVGPDQVGWKNELIDLSIKLGIENRITWTGMLTGDLKWGAYHVSECFVLPSRHESFGVVVAEALSCGLPTLISNKVNIWHEVVSDSAGFVSNDDLDGTVSIFEKWLNCTEDERELMRKNASDCFENRFEMASVAKRFISIIEDSQHSDST